MNLDALREAVLEMDERLEAADYDDRAYRRAALGLLWAARDLIWTSEAELPAAVVLRIRAAAAEQRERRAD